MRTIVSGIESDDLVAKPTLDYCCKSGECTSADEQYILGVKMYELLHRMLSTTLWRNVGDSPLDNLEQRLLHAFSANISCD